MANTYLDAPPALSGTEQQQLNALYRYLLEASEKLNAQAQGLTVDSFDEDTKARLVQVIGESGSEKTGMETLRSLIIKTASIIRHEMDEISTTLESNYVAISQEFGEYEKNLKQEITETAEGVMRAFGYEEMIRDIETGLTTYIEKSSNYIFTGLLQEATQDSPAVYGIAVGQNVTDYDENGEAVLNHENKVATFTKDRLSFYVGGNEVAYFSNQKFTITDGYIKETQQMGDRHIWRVLANGALALMKN